MLLYHVNENQLSEIASAIEVKEGKSLSLSYPGGFINTVKSINQEDYDLEMTRWFFENRDTMSSFPSSYVSAIKRIYFTQFANCENLQEAVFPECSIIEGYGFQDCFSLLSASFQICNTIGSFAFAGCENLQSIAIPECSLLIDYAFCSCSKLQQINLPKGVIIPQYTFAYCKSLSSVVAPLCTQIGSCAFNGCEALKKIEFPNCTSIGTYAFRGCSNLTSVSLPKCTYVGQQAFGSCSNLVSIDLPLVSSVGAWIFNSCTVLRTISIGKLKTVSYNNFSNVSASFIYLPELTTIYSSAFLNCSNLTYISLPSCSYLYSNCFKGCSKLQMLDLPKGRYFYGYSLFSGCRSLEAIYLTSTTYVTLSYSNAFYNCPLSNSTYLGYYGSIFVPSTMLASYKTRANWSYYSSRIVGVGSLIWFYVVNVGYTKQFAAENGATWGQWLDSPLNIGSAYSSTSTGGIYVKSTDTHVRDSRTFAPITISDLISDAATYFAL